MLARLTQSRAASIGLAMLDGILFGLGIAVIVNANVAYRGDGSVRFNILNELLTSGKLSDHSYSLIGPLVAAPLWYLEEDVEAKRQAVLYFNIILFGLTSVPLLLLMRKLVGWAIARVFVLLVLFATAFPHQLEDFNNEVFSAMLLACGTLALAFAGLAGQIAGGIAIILATANMPGLAIGVGLCIAFHALTVRRLRALVIPVLAAALILGESWLRRGSPWVSGYENNSGYQTVLPYSGLPGFSYPLLLGVLVIVLSFGKGLAFFSPGMFVPLRIWRTDPRVLRIQTMWLLVVLGLVLVYARWWAWYGGWCWGPRFFLFAAFPAMLGLAIWATHVESALSALAACIVIGWSLWTGYAGLIFGVDGLDLCTEHNYRLEAFCWYVPEYSPLIRPFIVARELLDWEINAAYLFGAVYLRVTLPLWGRWLRQTVRVSTLWAKALWPTLRQFRV